MLEQATPSCHDTSREPQDIIAHVGSRSFLITLTTSNSLCACTPVCPGPGAPDAGTLIESVDDGCRAAVDPLCTLQGLPVGGLRAERATRDQGNHGSLTTR